MVFLIVTYSVGRVLPMNKRLNGTIASQTRKDVGVQRTCRAHHGREVDCIDFSSESKGKKMISNEVDFMECLLFTAPDFFPTIHLFGV